ncbi:hypothetical protein SAMN04488084_106149 [Pedobacter antarcticus]|nr:hypothetical protein SAMN04488084_106149 [Pedobacter antarcticus]
MALNLRKAQTKLEEAKITCFDKAMDPELFNNTVELSNEKVQLEEQFDISIAEVLANELEVANA